MIDLYSIREYVNSYTIFNILAMAMFPITRGIEPVCEYVYDLNEDGTCYFDYRDCEILMFLLFVIVIKNKRWASPKEYMANLFLFSKCASVILFFRQDARYGFLYSLLCLLIFVAFPEPSYMGPDKLTYFRGSGLDEALHQHPQRYYLVEFYAVWSPPCARFSSLFARLSLRYGNDFFVFGKLDVTKYRMIADRYKIDVSVKSKNLPTLVLFEDGKEKMRRPYFNTKGAAVNYNFNEENIIRDFNLNEIYGKTKGLKDPRKKEKKVEQATTTSSKKDD